MACSRPAAILFAILAAGCAFRRGDPLPAEPPGDFFVEVVVRDAATWPWNGRLTFGADGGVGYHVTFKDSPSTRRGMEPPDAAARRAAWAAVVAVGFFDRPPAPAEPTPGPVVVVGRAMGLEGRREGDPATDFDLAVLLEVLRRAAPPRVFRPIPAAEPPR
jgi:hypothetical protein